MNGTIEFKNKPRLTTTYTVVGPKEKNSVLGLNYDLKLNDDKFGESGTPEQMLQNYHLKAVDIVEKVKAVLARKK